MLENLRGGTRVCHMAQSDGKGLRRSINPLTAIPIIPIFLTSQILCFPRTERRYHSTLKNLLKFQIKRVNSNLVLFAVKTTPSLAGLVWDISE